MKKNTKRRSRAAVEATRPRRRMPRADTGMPPGTPLYIGTKAAASSTISVYLYDEGSWKMECPLGLEALFALLEEGKRTWINVNGLGDGVVEGLCAHYGIHPLVVEDILNTGHRPKVESYPDYLFLITKMLTLHGEEIEFEQVSLIRKGEVVISFQETPGDCLDPLRKRIATGAGRIRSLGSDYLLYAILDLIVDYYFEVIEHLGDRIEAFENEADEARPSPEFMPGFQALRRELARMRKTVWPVRDSVAALIRLEGRDFGPELAPYLRDLQENAVQAIETLESYREHAASVLEIHLASVNNRMGQVMKVLTIISTIFIPLTFIAGVYGMNFHHMPELEQAWAYPAVLGFMTLIALGELALFKFKNWI